RDFHVTGVQTCALPIWHKVDRIWTIDIQSGKVKLMHKRTVDMEIAGHEFFSPDGKMIWYDLQVPRSVNFFLAGTDVLSGKEKRRSAERRVVRECRCTSS